MSLNDKKDRKNISRHILPTSANLLGLCFLILSLKKLWRAGGIGKFVDKLDGVAIIIFLGASVLSYMSMRSKNGRNCMKGSPMASFWPAYPC